MTVLNDFTDVGWIYRDNPQRSLLIIPFAGGAGVLYTRRMKQKSDKTKAFYEVVGTSVLDPSETKCTSLSTPYAPKSID